jgi:diguanylate cyclase (GGDEF)-like protein
MTDDLVATATAAELRRLQSAAETLTGAPGPRALARRFAELLARHFGVARIECLRIQGRGAKLSLKRRPLKIQSLGSLPDEALTELTAVFARRGPDGELADGATDMTLAGLNVTVALVPDPQGSGMALVWERPQPAGDGAAAVLRQLFLETLVGTFQNEARWLRRLDQTQAMIYQDDLTGLYNYRYFEIALDNELRRADRFQTQFCLLFLDMDGFKPINDQHGHLSGSNVLRQVADVLREAVREVDIPIRYGGDEFVVVLLGATCAKGVLAAERVRRRIEAREFQLGDGGTARLTCSIGVAAFPEHGRDRETLLKMADETMYDSKKAGKNRVTVVSREGSHGR